MSTNPTTAIRHRMTVQSIAIGILLLLLLGSACWVVQADKSQVPVSNKPQGPMAKLAQWTEPERDLEAHMKAVWLHILGDTDGMSSQAFFYGVDDLDQN